ncbi:MAG TPA: hypothetical protein VE077_00070, partial [Candidatus Methylomirabilis sp.]|nr:hypothetical protein [Candidatus Methylomirabilis sp.]
NRFGKLMPRLKTRAGKRQVDVHPEVAKELLAARHGRDGLMFPSREGTPLSSNNVERRLLRTHVTGSWHQFRRFRSTWLRKNRCLEDLKDIWLGHKRPVLDEAYIRMREDVETRLAEAERVGLGFKIVPLGEVKIRRIGKPRGWTRGKSARRVGVGEVVGKRRLRED